jgi:hypothetical protein
MKTAITLILAASAAFFTPAHAQSVSIRQKGEHVTLMKEAYHPMFYKAAAVLKGRRYEACWTIAGSDVLVIFDDGEYSTFPSEMFKKDESL